MEAHTQQWSEMNEMREAIAEMVARLTLLTARLDAADGDQQQDEHGQRARKR